MTYWAGSGSGSGSADPCHLKKLTWKGTLRQVLSRIYRLEVMLVFSTKLCELLPLTPSLWFNSPPAPPPPVPVVCKGGGGGYGVLGLRQTPAAKSLYRPLFSEDDILHYLQ